MPRVKPTIWRRSTARAPAAPHSSRSSIACAAPTASRWHVATTYAIPAETGLEGWLAVAIDIDDRKRAEESLRFIERAGARLAQSLDLQTTFDVILDLVVPEVADWAMITLSEVDGQVGAAAARHRDPAKSHLTAELVGADYFRDGYAEGTLAMYQTGEVVRRSDIERDFLFHAIQERSIPVIEALDYESLLALPIFAGVEVIGSLTLIAAEPDQRFATADLRGLEELTRRTSFAIANAGSSSASTGWPARCKPPRCRKRCPTSRDFASLPTIVPDGANRSSGGDRYDAIVTDEDTVVLSVGDVAGSGLAAAVRMNMMRHVLRAAAQVSTEPAAILALADRTLRGEDGGALVTAFVAVIAIAERTMRYASAGHVPALVREADGTIVPLNTPGPPLGCGISRRPKRTRWLSRPLHACSIPMGSSNGRATSSKAKIACGARLRRWM